jgi:hypothetical protein
MMAKSDDKSGGEVNSSASGRNVEPTIFARMMDLHCELRNAVGLEPLPGWEPTNSTPEWAKNICIRYRQTILKSILKLKPKRRVNWQNYGRCIGLIERCKVFYTHDVPKILKKEGLDRLSEKQQAKFDAVSGEEEMREYYLKMLKRPLSDKASLEELLTLASKPKLEDLDKHRQVALYHVANQDAKAGKMFYKGMNEGYSIFLNEDGEFSGDDRRADVYGELLAFQYEVEKMRRTLPAKTRKDLRIELKKSPAFQDRGQEWFNDVCDEIKLSMKGVGDPYKFLKSASSSG